MIRAYVAGPYRDGRGAWFVARNIQNANDIGADVAELGAMPVIPHNMWAFWDGSFPDKTFLAWALNELSTCHCMVVLPESGESAGTLGEIDFAHKQIPPIPVYYWPGDRDDIAAFIERHPANERIRQEIHNPPVDG